MNRKYDTTQEEIVFKTGEVVKRSINKSKPIVSKLTRAFIRWLDKKLA